MNVCVCVGNPCEAILCWFQTVTQEIRKRKEMEHEMLTNPVKGFGGSVSLTRKGGGGAAILAGAAM